MNQGDVHIKTQNQNQVCQVQQGDGTGCQYHNASEGRMDFKPFMGKDYDNQRRDDLLALLVTFEPAKKVTVKLAADPYDFY